MNNVILQCLKLGISFPITKLCRWERRTYYTVCSFFHLVQSKTAAVDISRKVPLALLCFNLFSFPKLDPERVWKGFLCWPEWSSLQGDRWVINSVENESQIGAAESEQLRGRSWNTQWLCRWTSICLCWRGRWGQLKTHLHAFPECHSFHFLGRLFFLMIAEAFSKGNFRICCAESEILAEGRRRYCLLQIHYADLGSRREQGHWHTIPMVALMLRF